MDQRVIDAKADFSRARQRLRAVESVKERAETAAAEAHRRMLEVVLADARRLYAAALAEG